MHANAASVVPADTREFLNGKLSGLEGDFPADRFKSEVEEPMGGEEGITIYDMYDLDPDYEF